MWWLLIVQPRRTWDTFFFKSSNSTGWRDLTMLLQWKWDINPEVSEKGDWLLLYCWDPEFRCGNWTLDEKVKGKEAFHGSSFTIITNKEPCDCSMPVEPNVTLAQRQGVQLHFILSVNTHALSKSSISWASASASVKQIILCCPGPLGGPGYAQSLTPSHCHSSFFLHPTLKSFSDMCLKKINHIEVILHLSNLNQYKWYLFSYELKALPLNYHEHAWLACSQAQIHRVTFLFDFRRQRQGTRNVKLQGGL